MENTAHTGASSRKERLGRMGIPPSKLPQMRPNLGHEKRGLCDYRKSPGGGTVLQSGKGRLSSAPWGCHPLVYNTSAGQRRSRPDQSADWSALWVIALSNHPALTGGVLRSTLPAGE